MPLFFSSNYVRGKRILLTKCIPLIALTIVLTVCNHASWLYQTQERFKIGRRLSQAICKQSTLFAKENIIQPPLKDPSKFPPSNKPSCKFVLVVQDWDAEEQVCKKIFMCTFTPPDNITDPDPNQTYDEPCDPPLPEEKIVGGLEACPHEFPYQVRLRTILPSNNFCGGSLISDTYVLTAAHCMRRMNTLVVAVILGDHDQTMNEGTEQTVAIETSTSHERYSYELRENNIALLKVTPRIQLNKNVQPIFLPRADYDPTKGNAVVCGWGALISGGKEEPSKLQKVTVPIVSSQKCKEAYDVTNVTEGVTSVTEYHICSGDLMNGGKNPCRGDGGGALAQKLPNGSYIQIGIASWARGCGDPGNPNVYTKVSKYVDWIREHMK